MYAVVLVVALAVVVATYLTWLAMRIDRLGSRVRGARAALDVQLDRRADAAREAAERAGPEAAPVREAAIAALAAQGSEREAAESGLTRALRATALVPSEKLQPAEPQPDEPQTDVPQTDVPQTDVPQTGEPRTDELRTDVARVAMARQFHNDAVRDLRTLRGRWLVRYLHLGGRSPLPGYFEIDDDVTLPVATYSGSGPGAGPVPASGPAEARPGQPSHT